MAQFCETCGKKMNPEDRPKGGRPSKYCDVRLPDTLDKNGKTVRGKKPCSEFAAAMNTLMKYAAHVQDEATPERWLEIRGDVFQMVNARAWNRGVPIPGIKRGKDGRFC